jgi:ankyrin repeat protein
MKPLNTFQFQDSKPLLCLIAIFLFVIAAGCSNKDSPIKSLQQKKIAVSADNLCFFASKGDLATVKLLLDAGVDVNAKDSRGSRALIDASWAGKQDVVLHLLDAKADVNGASAGQLTALSAAINTKQESLALLLLERGANPNIVDPAGSSPLIECSWQGNVPLVKALLAKGAMPNYRRPSDGMTALKVAVAAQKADIIQMLKAVGATE